MIRIRRDITSSSPKYSGPTGVPVRTRRANKGFTLVEMLAAIGVLAALMAIAIPMYSKYRLQAQIAQATSELRNLDLKIQIYTRTQGSLPSNLASLGVTIQPDPWGRSYEYLKIEGGGIWALFYAKKDFFEIPINQDFDLYSRGPDGATSSIVFLPQALDDVMRGASGQYFGLASNY